jgi:DivIVA domain-containing protein
MQQDSIERIRSATFSIARKGYEKREVERFLGKVADWLEAGGGDQARSDLVKRELERVGEKTASILASAEDSAAEIRAEAEQEAEDARGRADEDARRRIAEAQAKAKRIVDEGVKRRQNLESVISDLVSRRDAVLSDVERLVSQLKAAASSHTPPPGADRFAAPSEPDPADRAAAGAGARPRERSAPEGKQVGA